MFSGRLELPKLDGFQFVKTVRAMERRKDTPIVMVTSEAARYNVVDAIKAGVTNYVVKPIESDLLWEDRSPYLQS